MLFHVVDQHFARRDAAVVLQNVDDQARALQLVLEMRRMHQDQLFPARGQINMLLQDRDFVAAVFVQANLADAENVWAIEKFRDHRQHLVGQLHVFGFFGIDAKPGKMRQTEPRRPLRFVLG